MENVILLGGIFKESQEIGKKYLLHLDVDRLLAPCYEAINQIPKKPRYGGWEEKEISGHSLGHFLSALCAMYIADNDIRLKEKADYIVSELAYLQDLDEEGYVSGFPRKCFDKVFSGNFNVTRFELGDSWVPWYSIHKIYAGLIDAYELIGNEQALKVVTKLADWAKKGTDNLNEDQFEKMLYCEHGGMCEAMANLYKITKNQDYLNLSIRFIHKETINPLIDLKDELEGKHANTQIPKVIGVATLYEITGKEEYKRACEFFWNIVTKGRSYAIGGNSRDEHFGKCGTEKLDVTTAETCNTYNMLKLTEHLYEWHHKAEYMDYYEKSLYNHILASQDPDSGMKTYFVSTKPGHFKVYCTPDNSFWCCTGTGMENPARYIRNIYFKDNDSLFVNLFISSKINIEDKKIKISQITNFPEEENIKLVIEEADNEFMSIRIRIPYWVSENVQVTINNETVYIKNEDSYITISRTWNKGDIVNINLPMNIHLYNSKENKNEIVFMYGPLVLAGALGKENFPETDILDDHLKLNHHPGINVPKLVGDIDEISSCITKINEKELIFESKAIGQPENVKVKLIPFYKVTHERYTIYWSVMSEKEYKNIENNTNNYQDKIEKITIDQVNPNNQQSEIEHKIKALNSKSDYSKECGQGWRECRDNGYFSYEVQLKNNKKVYLLLTYWGSDREIFEDGKMYSRKFKIYAEDLMIAQEKLDENKPFVLFNKIYGIPEEVTNGKSYIRIKFESEEGSIAGRVFGLKIISEEI